jgi:hypothetical protein
LRVGGKASRTDQCAVVAAKPLDGADGDRDVDPVIVRIDVVVIGLGVFIIVDFVIVRASRSRCGDAVFCDASLDPPEGIFYDHFDQQPVGRPPRASRRRRPTPHYCMVIPSRIRRSP